jgi:putative ABC transport system permease protein
LRTQALPIPLQSWLGYALGLGGFLVLMWWVAQDIKLGAGLAAGFVAAAGIFALVSLICLWSLSKVRVHLDAFPVLRFALAGVIRRRGATVAQTSALAIGMMAILLLAIVRTDLLAGWQRTLPADAPNRFLINVQTDQVDEVRRALSKEGLAAVQLSPMVRGRLIANNSTAVSAADYTDARAQRLVEREFNLSYASKLPEINQIVAANVSGSAAVNTTVSIYTNGAVAQGSAPSSGTAFPIASTVSVPVGASLIVVDKTSALYLMEGTSITVTSGTASGITYSISYELIA